MVVEKQLCHIPLPRNLIWSLPFVVLHFYIRISTRAASSHPFSDARCNGVVVVSLSHECVRGASVVRLEKKMANS